MLYKTSCKFGFSIQEFISRAFFSTLKETYTPLAMLPPPPPSLLSASPSRGWQLSPVKEFPRVLNLLLTLTTTLY
jgi:hypothetical protein